MILVNSDLLKYIFRKSPYWILQKYNSYGKKHEVLNLDVQLNTILCVADYLLSVSLLPITAYLRWYWSLDHNAEELLHKNRKESPLPPPAPDTWRPKIQIPGDHYKISATPGPPPLQYDLPI